MTKPELRDSGKQWRARNSKSTSGESFLPSSESPFNRRWGRWIILTSPLRSRGPLFLPQNSHGQNPLLLEMELMYICCYGQCILK